jgi:hypothetical protein
VLRQFNPAKDVHLKAGNVRKIVRITGAAEAS